MHATPSSSALWASMGPAIASPMARMEGIFVWKVAMSTTTLPARSVSMPISSRPRPAVLGRLPVATSTTSASISSAAPPAAGSTVSLTPLGVTVAPVTLVCVLILNPCFFSTLSMAFLVSPSMLGTMFLAYSSTCTSAPSLPHTDPISNPMIPPPMITNFLGTCFRLSAPVDETIFSSSISTPGRGVTSEPVAMTMFFAFMISWVPSDLATVT
mmetsp:Transcript_4794/g.30402  ORF Transcript_4794/g.30402 Transcript_4794/m.30402 type:complete len:213 (-) Transcript_4794:649-1287(-)